MASVQKEKKRQQQPSHKGNTAWRAAVTPFPFNPNTADSTTFRRLGLPDWMTRNILRYRSRGGKFRKAEDFKKIYGLTEKQYLALLPCLRIAEEDLTREMPRPLYAAPATESLIGNRQAENYKYPPGTVINLNRADTAELKKIPGIGSNIARLIASYRQRLGGFCRIEQLQEIRLNYQQLQPWFHIDSRELRRINLNRAGIEGLRSHPYINFYQAKAFVEYRKKKGVLCSLKPFALYEEFSETDLERISPYVCFE
ncbi:helix-hairpin-helix domain-containing protein [Bacteroides helcogenes]|uniref:helix-hairpin-helix domain-containing protein n=1 Tax=Bacteroides helcogenes TaxID=290053 RepID=UPI0003032EC2